MILFCAPATAAHVPGSVTSSCTRCARAVWVAPSLFHALARNPLTTVVCLPCATANESAAIAAGEITPPTRAQVDEVRKYRSMSSRRGKRR
jgi:hypothetical protein